MQERIVMLDGITALMLTSLSTRCLAQTLAATVAETGGPEEVSTGRIDFRSICRRDQ